MSSSRFSTLRWRDGALELIDQRALPDREVYLRYDSAQAVAGAIRDMVVRGAPAIGCAAAYGVAVEAQRLAGRSAHVALDLEPAFESLAASRPTAVNLFWALGQMRNRLHGVGTKDAREVADALLDEAHALCAADVEMNRTMGAHGAALLPGDARVLTHCNAGARATAGHGTALGVIRWAIEAGKRIRVYADETRPFLLGARLTAWELAQDGIPVTLIADVAAGFLMSRNEIDAIVVGADRVAANGDVANKIGTYQIAVLANRHAVPFYVACPTSTIDPAVESGAAIPIEERGAEEVLGYRDMRWAPPGVSAVNPVFDVTPAELVTALITEKGVVKAPDRTKIAALLAK